MLFLWTSNIPKTLLKVILLYDKLYDIILIIFYFSSCKFHFTFLFFLSLYKAKVYSGYLITIVFKNILWIIYWSKVEYNFGEKYLFKILSKDER